MGKDSTNVTQSSCDDRPASYWKTDCTSQEKQEGKEFHSITVEGKMLVSGFSWQTVLKTSSKTFIYILNTRMQVSHQLN